MCSDACGGAAVTADMAARELEVAEERHRDKGSGSSDDRHDANLARDSSSSFREGLERHAAACEICHKKLVKHVCTVANNLKNRR